jgi:Domain of unknown function (DUF5911)
MAHDVRAGRVGRVEPVGVQREPRARYLPIAEHGLIGDLHTVALVGTDGTIDWYCCPRFDSPSVFAAILDADQGGLFRISADCDGWSSKQLYLPDTNVLITRFLTPDGVGEVQDFMPPPRTGEAAYRHRMIRRVAAVRGQMHFMVDVAPRFDYARARHEVTLTPHGALFRSPELELGLSARCPLEIVGGRDVRARVGLRARETATFVLDRIEPGEMPAPHSEADLCACAPNSASSCGPARLPHRWHRPFPVESGCGPSPREQDAEEECAERGETRERAEDGERSAGPRPSVHRGGEARCRHDDELHDQRRPVRARPVRPDGEDVPDARRNKHGERDPGDRVETPGDGPGRLGRDPA